MPPGLIGNLGAPLRSRNELDDEDEEREVVIGSSNPLAMAVEELASKRAEKRATLKMDSLMDRDRDEDKKLLVS